MLLMEEEFNKLFNISTTEDDEREEEPGQEYFSKRQLPLTLDIFMQNMYIYYSRKGKISVIILQETYGLFSTIVTLCFSTYIFHHYINIPYLTTLMVVTALLVAVYKLAHVVITIRYQYIIHQTFVDDLQIYSMIPWDKLVSRISTVFDTGGASGGVGMDVFQANDLVMRFDNYMIALANKTTLLPPALYTMYLETILIWVMKHSLFTLGGHELNAGILSSNNNDFFTRRLKRSILIVTLIAIVATPFALTIYLVHFINMYISSYRDPGSLGNYSFTPLSRWKFRDYNELEHDYHLRMRRAEPKIIHFLTQFKSDVVLVLVKFFHFAVNSTICILCALILQGGEFEQRLLFHIGLLMSISIKLRPVCSEQILEPLPAYIDLCNILHYVPRLWGTMNMVQRNKSLSNLFTYNLQVTIVELASVLYTPFLLVFFYYQNSSVLVSFYRENSVRLTSLGIICSSSLSNTRGHLGANDHKMTHSINGFKEVYLSSS